MLANFLLVGIGGALGAALRYGLGLVLARDGFPLAVIAANVAGSFLMGLVAALLLPRGMGLLLMTGLLGGFTTFSAFSLEAVALWQRGEPGQAAAYVLLSVVGALGALALGLAIGRAGS